MNKINLIVGDKVLAAGEWGIIRAKVPTIYRIENNHACICIPGASYNIFISEQAAISSLFDSLEPVEISPAPNLGISESLFLKALAVAQDPKLVRELL